MGQRWIKHVARWDTICKHLLNQAELAVSRQPTAVYLPVLAQNQRVMRATGKRLHLEGQRQPERARHKGYLESFVEEIEAVRFFKVA